MKATSLATIAGWAGGALIQGVPTENVSALYIDSRRVAEGSLFLALKGDRFDAHDFLAEVVEASPTAVLVSSLRSDLESFSGGVIHVRDTLKALQELAFHYRRSCPDLHVVGVTGSNGKTSTKDFLGSVLGAAGAVNRTAGNLNNHIGLPLTILSGDGGEAFGVWEMGMNHPGEIEILAEIAGVDAAVITHIGTAHIEHMGSREAIAAEKAELAFAVPSGGYCVMPESDPFCDFVREGARAKMISVGIEVGDVQAKGLSPLGDGRVRFELVSEFGRTVPVILPVRGRHMVNNALLAAAVGLQAGLEPATVAERLATTELTGGRLQDRRAGGFTFLDDSYNANPDSMEAALAVLRDSGVEGRRVAVLGFMGELGEHEEREHLALGKKLHDYAVDLLVTVGERAAVINRGAGGAPEHRNFPDHALAAEFLRGCLAPEDLVLVKGSRAARMERVIEELS